jgi:DNA-binding GntR family transcriptional regulator
MARTRSPRPVGLDGFIRDAKPRYPTAADFVVATLREAIASGAIERNDALRQEELAARFGVSRMPVRDALRRLEAEGLVAYHPRRGAFVADLGREDAGEIFWLRGLLEGEALRLSIPRLTPAALDEAAAVLDEIDREDDVARWGALNLRFHMALYSACGSRRLLDLIESQYPAADRHVRVLLSHLQYREASQAEHRALLACCRAGQVEQALALLGDHLGAARTRLMQFLERGDSGRAEA